MTFFFFKYLLNLITIIIFLRIFGTKWESITYILHDDGDQTIFDDELCSRRYHNISEYRKYETKMCDGYKDVFVLNYV